MLPKLSPYDKQGGKRYSVLTSISFTSEPDPFFFRFYWPLVFLSFPWKLSLHVFLKSPFLLYVFPLLPCKIHFHVGIHPTHRRKNQPKSKEESGRMESKLPQGYPHSPPSALWWAPFCHPLRPEALPVAPRRHSPFCTWTRVQPLLRGVPSPWARGWPLRGSVQGGPLPVVPAAVWIQWQGWQPSDPV